MKKNADGWLSDVLEDREVLKGYHRERLMERFLFQVEQLMEQREISRSELARLMGCSAANITQLFRKSRNLTLEKMADIGLALDHRIDVYVRPFDAEEEPCAEPWGQPPRFENVVAFDCAGWAPVSCADSQDTETRWPLALVG